MDEKLQKALDFANFSTTLNNQKKMAKERFAEQTIYFTIQNHIVNPLTMLAVGEYGMQVDKVK